MRRLLFYYLMFSTAVLLLSACNRGGPEPVMLDFTGLDSFRFHPPSASVEAGSEVTIRFENAGVLDHAWMLTSNEADLALVRESDALSGAFSGVISGGDQHTFTFVAPTAGEYKVVCTVPGHAAAGMVAAFTIAP